MDPVLLAQELIRCTSETAHSNAVCSALVQRLLEDRGFRVSWYDYRDTRGCPKVTLAAQRPGRRDSNTGIAFFCHSDVVSTEGWKTTIGCGPIDAIIAEERLWGRGACDMKGPIASVLAAIDSVDVSSQTADIFVFVTGDEECGMVGADLLVKRCPLYRQVVHSNSMSIITEPTELRVVARHKGGCRFRVVAHGTAAHSSTTDGLNANWQLIPWLNHLSQIQRRTLSDPGLKNDDFDPPTLNLNLVLKNQPTEANITVSQAQCEVFLRTMPDTQWQGLVDEMVAAARDMELEVSAVSVLAPLATSLDCRLVRESLDIVGQESADSVGYATDGCCYRDIAELIVIGPGSIEQAHRCDEWISLEQLRRGSIVYEKLIRQFAC